MKLYVWRDVLSGYAPGMAFAIAESSDHARLLILSEIGIADDRDFDKEPEIHDLDTPFAAYIYGGD